MLATIFCCHSNGYRETDKQAIVLTCLINLLEELGERQQLVVTLSVQMGTNHPSIISQIGYLIA